MSEHDISRASTTEGLPVAPSHGPTLQLEELPRNYTPLDYRVLFLSGLSVLVAVAAGVIAQGLVLLIGLNAQRPVSRPFFSIMIFSSLHNIMRIARSSFQTLQQL